MDPVPPSFTQNIEPVSNSSGICSWKLTPKKIIISILIFLGILIIWQWINSPTIVTVSGIGSVTVPATSASITLTITANADTPSASISSIKAKAQVVRDYLISKGIAEGDIAESQVSSYPAAMVIVGSSGYQSSIQMSAKTVHVTTVSELVGELYSIGVNLVSQPVLSVENQEELEAKAMTEALKDARKQISKIGLKNFKFIRKAIALSEQSSSTTSTATTKADLLTQDVDSEAAINGVFKIAKAVTISYKMW